MEIKLITPERGSHKVHLYEVEGGTHFYNLACLLISGPHCTPKENIESTEDKLQSFYHGFYRLCNFGEILILLKIALMAFDCSFFQRNKE